jgi:hypothetical protein
VSIIGRLKKERCISLVARRRPFFVARKHDWNKCAPPPCPPLNLKNILLQNGSIENTKPKRLCWQVTLVLDLPLLLNLIICMQATLEELWMR